MKKLWLFALWWWSAGGHSLYEPLYHCCLCSVLSSASLPHLGYLSSIQTDTIHHLHLAVLHPSQSTSAQLSSANMTGQADDDKCRGGKAITGSVRCSRERSGHSLPTDCRVWDAHTLALTNTHVHPRRVRRINNKLEVTAEKMMSLFCFLHPREVIKDTFPCSSAAYKQIDRIITKIINKITSGKQMTWTRLQTHNLKSSADSRVSNQLFITTHGVSRHVVAVN